MVIDAITSTSRRFLAHSEDLSEASGGEGVKNVSEGRFAKGNIRGGVGSSEECRGEEAYQDLNGSDDGSFLSRYDHISISADH